MSETDNNQNSNSPNNNRDDTSEVKLRNVHLNLDPLKSNNLQTKRKSLGWSNSAYGKSKSVAIIGATRIDSPRSENTNFAKLNSTSIPNSLNSTPATEDKESFSNSQKPPSNEVVDYEHNSNTHNSSITQDQNNSNIEDNQILKITEPTFPSTIQNAEQQNSKNTEMAHSISQTTDEHTENKEENDQMNNSKDTASKLASMAAKRREVITEFLETEKQYIQNLEVAINIFLIPLRDANVLTKLQLISIFSNIETLYDTNKHLFGELLIKYDEQSVRAFHFVFFSHNFLLMHRKTHQHHSTIILAKSYAIKGICSRCMQFIVVISRTFTTHL